MKHIIELNTPDGSSNALDKNQTHWLRSLSGIKIAVNYFLILKLFFMPWTKKDYPASMKNLPGEVRNKAIEIDNCSVERKNMDEEIASANFPKIIILYFVEIIP